MVEGKKAEQQKATGPLAGEPRERGERGERERAGGAPARYRVATWLAWWVLMMSLWVAVDDSVQFDDLLAGAGAAALAALLAELVTFQAVVRFRVRGGWLPQALPQALRLPGRVAQDTVTVFAALARTLVTGQPPRGGFAEIPVRHGDDSPAGVTRRVLLTGAQSLAPNTFVIGIDAERDVMLVHQLVRKR